MRNEMEIKKIMNVVVFSAMLIPAITFANANDDALNEVTHSLNEGNDQASEITVQACKVDKVNKTFAKCRVHAYIGSEVTVFDLTCNQGFGCKIDNSYVKKM
jgi:hypothetical protein